MTTALFLVVEPLIGQVIEPLVYGHSTGLTPVAVIIAATFWTWLWGPIGLLLSTPLTVCLGVLGRHIPWLRFLDVMIGDDPPLSPAQSFYQRALAGDIDEAVDQAVEILPRRSLSYVYDNVVLEALHLAQIDFRRGLLDSKHVEQMNEAVHELIADTIEYEDITPPVGARKDSAPGEKSDEPPSLPDVPVLRDFPSGSGAKPVLCVTGRGPFDDAVAKSRGGGQCRCVILEHRAPQQCRRKGYLPIQSRSRQQPCAPATFAQANPPANCRRNADRRTLRSRSTLWSLYRMSPSFIGLQGSSKALVPH
jgi:hypothetical protein